MNRTFFTKGFSLVELIVAILILSSGILAFIAAFQNISQGLIFSKNRTLGTNLCQEGMQIIKQLPYFKIFVTSSPVFMTEFTPPVPYDPGIFPPERILEGGTYFTRSYYIQRVQEVDGTLVALPPTADDTGMKLITVNVVWSDGAKKRIVQLKNIVSNLDISSLPGTVRGTVRNAVTLSPISNTIVTIAENVGWRDLSDSQGNYSISLIPGTFFVIANAQGYFPGVQQVSVGANPVTVNFNLVPRSSGTIIGEVWLNDHIVISQIVASTISVSGVDQEYLELYNPTTYWWVMARYDPVSGTTVPVTGVKYRGPFDSVAFDIPLRYNRLSIPPSSYYLISNVPNLEVFGVTISADAVWVSSENVIKCREDATQEGAGSIGIYRISDSSWIDLVGWNGGTGTAGWKQAPMFEGSPISQDIGFQRGEQFVRRSYVHGGTDYNNHLGIISGIARSYDSNNNDGAYSSSLPGWRNGDFADILPLRYYPRNSFFSEPYIACTPAYGAVITCDDGLSGGVIAVRVDSSTLAPRAVFELTSVATGTWNVYISSKEVYARIENVTVTGSTRVFVPNNNTVPTWPVAGYSSIFLTHTIETGLITGEVRNAFLQPLSGIKVSCSGSETFTNASGKYFLPVSSGIYTVVANPGNFNPIYTSEILPEVEVKPGAITSGKNFILVHCGGVRGLVRRDAVNPLEGVMMVAEHIPSGIVRGEGISDVNGRFIIPNLSTGTYYIKPILSGKETSIPVRSTVTVSVGMTVFAGTFTVTGSLGRITGEIFSQGKRIKSGVLLLATTRHLPSPYVIPVLSSATVTGVPYYLTSSYEDGRYVLEVVGSTTTPYNVYAYYVTYNVDIPSISAKVRTNILVPPGVTKSGEDFHW